MSKTTNLSALSDVVSVDGNGKVVAPGFQGTSYYHSATGQPDWYTANYQGDFYINGNGGDRLKIDSAGRVTMPYQPFFRAYDSSGGHVTRYDNIPFNSTHENEGNHFNTSTGAFTAPVAGRYLFTWNSYTDGFGTSGRRCFLRVNNNDVIQSGGSGNGVPITFIVTLAANDIVTLGGNVYYGIYYYAAGAHNEFQGYLLG